MWNIYRRAKYERVWLGEATSDCSLIDTLFLGELGPCDQDSDSGFGGWYGQFPSTSEDQFSCSAGTSSSYW
jgi:hypothetical protein